MPLVQVCGRESQVLGEIGKPSLRLIVYLFQSPEAAQCDCEGLQCESPLPPPC